MSSANREATNTDLSGNSRLFVLANLLQRPEWPGMTMKRCTVKEFCLLAAAVVERLVHSCGNELVYEEVGQANNGKPVASKNRRD